MALRDPFAAYNAESELEAQEVSLLLIEAGITAMVIVDSSQLAGMMPEVQNPQVWIEREDIARATIILNDYEAKGRERRKAERENAEAEGEPIMVVCPECGHTIVFPASLRGTVQDCPKCQAYMDVGDSEELEGWNEVPPEDDEETEER